MGWFSRRPKAPPTYQRVSADLVPARQNPFRAELEQIQRDHDASSLTASGELIRHGQASLLRRLIQPWQIRSFGYYDLLGEIKYASQFYSRALAALELFAAEVDADGEVVPTENEVVKDALARIRDPGGSGRTGLQADYGRLMFLVGEAYLFVTINPNTDMEQWEMLSTDELRALDGNYTRFRAPSLPATQFRPAPDDAFKPIDDRSAVAYRIWKRHPRFSQLPDATMEGILDLCEELVLLTQAVRARARSRLANSGILFIDDRITTQPVEPVPDEDPLSDPFIADLTESMTLPITDEGTPSAVVPLVARVHVPEGMRMEDFVYHLRVLDPTLTYPEEGLRMECIRRIAIGLDMPPEVLLGLSDSNHWSAWQIDEQVWKAHLQPIANQLVQDLTSAYLGPYLREQGVQDWDRYLIAYDATKVINHPDRSKDAKDLHDRAVIGDEALREAAGFDEDDKPDEKELARRIGILTRDSSLAWDGTPAPRGGAVETSPGVIVQAEQPGDPNQPGPKTGAEVNKTPPTPPDEQTASAMANMVAGAAQMAILRCREHAGNQVRNQLRHRSPELNEVIDGAAAGDVCAALGASRVREAIGRSREGNLVAGSRTLIHEALIVIGVSDSTARNGIAETILRHAARTLYDRQPAMLPPSFPAYVTGMLAASSIHNDSTTRL